MMKTKRDDVVVVCARITAPLYIADNKIGKCGECGWKVQYRPHAPKGRKLCMKCAVDLLGPETKVTMAPRMLEDVKTYYRKKQQ